MRKTCAAVVFLGVALLGMSIPVAATPSHDPGAVQLVITISFTDPPGYWWGSVSGDLSGMVKFPGNPDEPNWFGGVSPAAHFHELFTICVGEGPTPDGCSGTTGSYLTGVDEGVYLFMSGSGKWHFVASGWVTGASSDLAYLIGYAYHENGWTTDPNLGLPIVGSASAFIAPA